MRTNEELGYIKSQTEFFHNSFGNRLLVSNYEKYDPEKHHGIAYCFRYKDDSTGNIVYRVESNVIDNYDVDLRILLHEYGHIYKGHLSGIHEELDGTILSAIRNNRSEISKLLNSNCGIEFADALLDRVIDDPGLNHSLHNIAMDMEINSTVLDYEDIQLIQSGMSEYLFELKKDEWEKSMAKVSGREEEKEEIRKKMSSMKAPDLIKFITPRSYTMMDKDLGERVPFPDGLTYPEYLTLLVLNLDQFVKMLVSLEKNMTVEISSVTSDDVLASLNKILDQMKQRFDQKSESYKSGYRQAMKDAQSGKSKEQLDRQRQGRKDGYSDNNESGPSGTESFEEGYKKTGSDLSGMSDNPSKTQGYSDKATGEPEKQGQGSDYENGQAERESTENSSKSGKDQDWQDGFDAGSRKAVNDSWQGSGKKQGPGSDYQQGYSEGRDQASSGNDQGDYDQGYNDAMNDIENSTGQSIGESSQAGQGLSDLMESLGISGGSESGRSGKRQEDGDGSESNSSGRDHDNEDRQKADELRESGQLRSNSSSIGCGNRGGGEIRDVESKDDVDTAIVEVLREFKGKVLKYSLRKDMMRNYNRGINRSVICPALTTKISSVPDPKIVFLLDVSGSMDRDLVDRIINTISKSIYKINRGLRYDIISWNTNLCQHIKNIDPKKSIPKIHCGGGTRMARGIEYFRDNYGKDSILVVMSDFEDYLEEWGEVESGMPGYSIWGFNYGRKSTADWKYLKQRDFSNYD